MMSVSATCCAQKAETFLPLRLTVCKACGETFIQPSPSGMHHSNTTLSTHHMHKHVQPLFEPQEDNCSFFHRNVSTTQKLCLVGDRPRAVNACLLPVRPSSSGQYCTILAARASNRHSDGSAVRSMLACAMDVKHRQ